MTPSLDKSRHPSDKQTLCKAIRNNKTSKERLHIVLREIRMGYRYDGGGFLRWISGTQCCQQFAQLSQSDDDLLSTNIRKLATQKKSQ